MQGISSSPTKRHQILEQQVTEQIILFGNVNLV